LVGDLANIGASLGGWRAFESGAAMVVDEASKDDRVLPEMKPIVLVLSQTLEITRVPRKMEAGECILLLLEVIYPPSEL